MDDALQIVGPSGAVLYRNRALERLTGTRMGRHATLEELFAGEPQSAEAFYRLNRAAEREEARDEEFHVRSQGAGGAGGRWLHVSVRPFARRRARGKRKTPDAVAGARRHARAHARDRDGERPQVDAVVLR